MVSTRELGEIAERLAQQHLVKLGYIIKATNWYHGHLELDIVAQDGNELVIVEVKARTGLRYEHPSEAVTNTKIKRIVEAADAYIIEHGIEQDTRFDVVTVIFVDKKFELEHFKDAFYPTM
uniref:YraN family protein n=1 Tax=uncultured Draconibacterium sp. TaxID=1573823 RepID=UPI003216C89E